MRTRYESLESVISDPVFVEVDVALRRGRHIDRDDGELYELLVDAQAWLEPFYRRYGCELVAQTDGYFYLLPRGERLIPRKLGGGEMIVGQTLALLYLEPSTVQTGGVVTHEHVLSRLSGLLGARDLAKALEPRRQRFDDERVVAELIRTKVAHAIRRLATLGFVEPFGEDRIRLRSPLLRFAEPVHGLSDRTEAMRRLVAEGKVTTQEDREGDTAEDDAADEEVQP
jgi:chromosome partition protein MukE